jgi:nicotinate-nucleotide adenylyltransferase
MTLRRERCVNSGVGRMKIGLMGGSFDPVHFGHLIAAQDVLEQFHLDRLLLVPAAQAPLKPNDVQSSSEDRLAMLRAATEWDHRLEISDYELGKGGVSYTIDSVRHFRAQFPHDELHWIIGGDQLPLLHKWKSIDELARMIEFIFLERPKHPTKPHPEIPGLVLHRCDGHLIEISSSELRQRVQRGLSLNYFCPQKVIAYIEAKKLYR